MTQLIKERELNQLLRKDIEEVKSACSSGTTLISGGYYADPVQTLVSIRRSSDSGIFLPIIESSAIDAEKNASGSGELFLKIFSHSMLGDLSRKSIGVDFDNEWNLILEKIEKFSIPARKRDIKNIFSLNSLESDSKIIDNVFDLIKSGDRVFIKKTSLQKTSISRESGYTFENLGIDPRFLIKGSWSRRNVKVVLIDGIIERVSEIHRFLEEMSKNKTPSLIFCLDALPEVYETLIKNYAMGNLDTILIKIPVIETHINTLADLGIIFGEEPISAGTGESISSGITRQKSIAERITITRNKVLIEDQKRKNQVQSHISDIRKRINQNIDLSQLLEKRVQSLSSSTIRVEVGIDDQKRDPRIIEKLDRTFRSLPKIIKRGFIKKNDFLEFSRDKIDLLFEKNDEISAEMAIQSIKIFLSTRENINSASVGIRSL